MNQSNKLTLTDKTVLLNDDYDHVIYGVNSAGEHLIYILNEERDNFLFYYVCQVSLDNLIEWLNLEINTLQLFKGTDTTYFVQCYLDCDKITAFTKPIFNKIIELNYLENVYCPTRPNRIKLLNQLINYKNE